MRLFLFSDLHLEFGEKFDIPNHEKEDILVFSGDISTDPDQIINLADSWNGNVIFVSGNHEYYEYPIELVNNKIKKSNIIFLNNESVNISGISFFGGTMWTDFNNYDPMTELLVMGSMNDYRCIKHLSGKKLSIEDASNYHKDFMDKLNDWCKVTDEYKVVITHHKPNTGNNNIISDHDFAFNSLDTKDCCDLWLFGHTHECIDCNHGKTRYISNARGYPNPYEFRSNKYKKDGFVINV